MRAGWQLPTVVGCCFERGALSLPASGEEGRPRGRDSGLRDPDFREGYVSGRRRLCVSASSLAHQDGLKAVLVFSS